jgi:hypothetical protein
VVHDPLSMATIAHESRYAELMAARPAIPVTARDTRSSLIIATRRVLGAALIALGERLQPRPKARPVDARV